MKRKFIFIAIILISIIALIISDKINLISNKSINEEKVVLSDSKVTLYKDNNILNNKSLTPEKAIKSGYVTEVASIDVAAGKSNNKDKVYNINNLDNFIKNIKNKNKDKIRIVVYAFDNKSTWVNKLYDLEYNGENIKYIVYDTYSDTNKFIPSEPFYYDKIIKREFNDYLWYGICSKDNKLNGWITIFSLKRSDIEK